MKIKKVFIKNFRGIDGDGVIITPDNFTFFIGDNGTSKTAIIEAINYCLSPRFLGGKLGNTDFYNGSDEDIEIRIEFDTNFKAHIPDGYVKQTVECNGVVLKAHKRDRGASGKAFCDLVVVEHYVNPVAERGASGWSQPRRTSPNAFEFTERHLSFPVEAEGLPRSFYFAKNREKQIQKGYSTSINSVLDDLNWRFSKKDRQKTAPEDKFTTKKTEFEKFITDNTDGDTIEKTFSKLNSKLTQLGVENVDLSFINTQAPYDSAFLSKKISDLDLPVSELGSGIEMIVSLLFLETLASLSNEDIVILIDEPELHLHPKLQDKFTQYLMGISTDIQVFASTHSPYFFKNYLSKSGVGIFIAKRNGQKVTVEDGNNQNFGLFPWSPSWGEINYRAYDLCTVEFHNELYGYIQEKECKYKELDIENYFVSKSKPKSKKWIRLQDGIAQSPYDMTLMSYVRNKIHHPENTNNADYTDAELKQSIENMISLIN